MILPKEAMRDWLNLKYSATDILRAAMATVEFWPVQHTQQIAMGGLL